jgi:plastocyanin
VLRRLIPAVCVLALAPAGSAGAAEVVVGDKSFSAADVSVAVGEAVTWRWTGGTHNVRVTTGPEKFDSGFKDAGGTYIHTFTAAGSYSYICDAHPSMRGAVTVAGGAAPSGAPAAGAVDAAPPRLSTVRVSRLAVLGLTASASGSLHARIVRGGRTVRRATMGMVAGRNRLPLRVRGLRPGRYRLSLQAVDAAGRRSASTTRVLLVTRAALARRPVAPPVAVAAPPAATVTPVPATPPPEGDQPDTPDDSDGRASNRGRGSQD